MSSRLGTRVRRATSAMIVGMVVAAGIATGASAQASRGVTESTVEYIGVVKGVRPYVDGVPQKEAYFLAIAVTGQNEVVAYTCDGFGEFASFSGTAQAGTFSATSSEGEQSQIEVTISSARAKGTLTFEGTDYDFTLKKARGVGGLYTVSLSASSDGTVTGAGTSERGNEFTAGVKPGQKRLTFTFTTVDGTTKTVRPTPLDPPKDLLGFDGYRAVFLDNARMGRGQNLSSSVQLNPPTPVSAVTIQRITSTVIQFY